MTTYVRMNALLHCSKCNKPCTAYAVSGERMTKWLSDCCEAVANTIKVPRPPA